MKIQFYMLKLEGENNLDFPHTPPLSGWPGSTWWSNHSSGRLIQEDENSIDFEVRMDTARFSSIVKSQLKFNRWEGLDNG